MRSTEARDLAFSPNWAAMAGLDKFVRGAYSFGSPDVGPDASEDASLFYQYLTDAGPLQPTDLLVLDLESSPLGQDATNQWARDWYSEFTRLLRADDHQHKPGIYMGSAYLNNRTGNGLNQLFSYLWYPRYPLVYDNTTDWPESFSPRPPNDQPWLACNWGQRPELWQFNQHFPEQGKLLDANLFDGTLAELQALNS